MITITITVTCLQWKRFYAFYMACTITVLSCMIERATVLRCENVNNQTFILHPGLSINREIRVFPRAVGNTGKY